MLPVPGLFVAPFSDRVPGETGRHPLPERQKWLERIQRWGVDPDKQVVVYDDTGGATAARMWWMLRWIGHQEVAVLDGGWQHWCNKDLPVSTELVPDPKPSSFDYASMPSLTRIIKVSEIDTTKQLLLDARESSRFLGESEPIDSVAGHIPGAYNCPFTDNLEENKLFKNPEALKRKYREIMKKAHGRPVVCYCGSGVTAAHNILAMKRAGLEEPYLYAGSWSEWIADPARPIAIGPI